MRIRLFFSAMVVLAILPALVSAADVVMIANPSVPDASLSVQEVSSIYQGKKSNWDDGSKIIIAILKGSPAHEQFLKDYVGKTENQFDTYWKKQVFTGMKIPPRIFDSEQAIVDFVARTPGAIGYVPAGARISNVKTINVQ